MMNILYCANFENTMSGKKIADENFIADGFRALGHTVYAEEFTKTKGVGVIHNDVDVVLCGKLHFPLKHFSDLRLAYAGKLFVGHHFENMHEKEQSPMAATREMFWINQFLMYDTTISCVNLDEKNYGANDWNLVHSAFNDYGDVEQRPIKERVLFIGMRNAERTKLIDAIRTRFEIDFVDNVFGKELAEKVRGYRVVLNHSSWAELGNTWNDRTYIVPGNGGVLLTNDCIGLDTQGVVGEHFFTYASVEDALWKLEHIFKHPEMYDAVRVNARKYFLENHTFKNRAEQFVEIFERGLAE